MDQKTQQFYDAVYNMREAQKAYKRDGAQADLMASKAHEATVDRLLRDYEEKIGGQTNLLDEFPEPEGSER